MKYVLYILSVLFLLLGLGELFTVGMIGKGLLEGQAAEDGGHFLFKLLIHLLYSAGAIAISWFLFTRARKGGTSVTSST